MTEEEFIRVHETEDLARFICSSSHCGNGRVNFRAFLPSTKTNDTSVFRHIGFSDPDAELSKLGEQIARNSSRNYHGRADIKAAPIYEQKLNIIPTEYPENHANIVGWPTEKEEQMSIAIELAANASFVPNAH